MMNKKSLIALVLLLFAFPVVANEVSGTIEVTVTDSGTTLSFTVVNCTDCNFTSYYNIDGSSSSDDDEDETTSTTNTTSEESESYNLAFVSLQSLVEVVQGESETIDVDVKNTGDDDLENVTFTITGLESSWYSIDSIDEIDDGDTESSELEITVPNSAQLEMKTFTLKAESGDAYASQKISLKILPNENTKKLINKTYENHRTTLIELNSTIYELADQGKGVKTAIDLFDVAWNKLDIAGNHITNDNYYDAFMTMKELPEAINNLRLEIEKIENSYAWWIYPLIAVGVVIIVVLIYLFIPQGEYEYEYVEEYE